MIWRPWSSLTRVWSHGTEALVKLDKDLTVQLAALGAMRQEQVALHLRSELHTGKSLSLHDAKKTTEEHQS